MKMSVDHCCNDTDGRQRKKKSQCHFVHQKPHVNRPGIEPLIERRWTDRGTACQARNSSKICIKVKFVPHREQSVSIIETILHRNAVLGNKLFLSRESKETHTLSGGGGGKRGILMGKGK